MRMTLFLFLIFLSVPSFSFQGGGDSGGGPRPEAGREILQLQAEAQRIALSDMELRSVVVEKVPAKREREAFCKRKACNKSIVEEVKKVKVEVKYSTPEVRCVENRRGKERCFDRFSVRHKSIYFDIDFFSEEVIEQLKKRKLFSKKSKFIELAKENITIDIIENDKGQVVILEVL